MKQLKLFGSSKIALSNFITHCVAVLIALIVVSAFGEGYLYHRSLGRRVPHTMTESSGSYPVVGPDSIMDPKEHGTCPNAVMSDLRWGCSVREADNICCFNRHYAEHSGYWLKTAFLKTVDQTGEITFFDSVTGKPLFIAPRGRSFQEFEEESRAHGWPSFRDQEVLWENVRCLSSGEAVSVDGTHLGHNLPDRNGNRYCINIVSVAGHNPDVV